MQSPSDSSPVLLQIAAREKRECYRVSHRDSRTRFTLLGASLNAHTLTRRIGTIVTIVTIIVVVRVCADVCLAQDHSDYSGSNVRQELARAHNNLPRTFTTVHNQKNAIYHRADQNS